MKNRKIYNCKKCDICIEKRINLLRLCESCYNKYIESIETDIKIINITNREMKRFLIETNI